MEEEEPAVNEEQSLEQEQMKLLLANFDGDQMARYEAFRRANINRSGVKKLANAVLNQSITTNVSVALSGMSKVLVGEVIEQARNVQAEMDPESLSISKPLRPEHLREAWRRYKLESNAIPGSRWHRPGDGGRLF